MTDAIFISRSTLLTKLINLEKKPLDTVNAELAELRHQRRIMAKNMRNQLCLATSQVELPNIDRPGNPRRSDFKPSIQKTPFQWIAIKFPDYRDNLFHNIRKSNAKIKYRNKIQAEVATRLNGLITGALVDPVKSSSFVLNTHA